jgi:hypothetical protein
MTGKGTMTGKGSMTGESVTNPLVSCPPPPPLPLHLEESSVEETIVELPLKEKTDDLPMKAKKPKATKKTKDQNKKKMSLGEFLDKPKEVTTKTGIVSLPETASHSILVTHILGFPLMHFIIRNSFEEVVVGLRKQLEHTVKNIMMLEPGFDLTTQTPPDVINHLVDVTYHTEHRWSENGLHEMLRSILAIHTFMTVMREFRSLTLRVSRGMINNALKYITKNTNGRNVEFDATEFFLNHVPLRQRTDGIAALLCMAICVRVEFNWRKGPHRFIIIMKACPKQIGKAKHAFAPKK